MFCLIAAISRSLAPDKRARGSASDLALRGGHATFNNTSTNVRASAFRQSGKRTNPSFTGLNIPLLHPLNDSPHRSPVGSSSPPRRPEYAVGRRNGSILPLQCSHSFFIQRVLCLFSSQQLQGNQTGCFVTFTQVQTAQWLFCSRRSGLIAGVEQSKGDPSSSHCPPFERLFYSGGALWSWSYYSEV